MKKKVLAMQTGQLHQSLKDTHEKMAKLSKESKSKKAKKPMLASDPEPPVEQGIIIPQKIKFYNIKSQFFRSIHADGMWGATSPHGHYHFTFYNERPAIPQVSVNELTPTGHLGNELIEERQGKNGIVREMEVDVILDKAAALRLYDWLKTALKPDQQ